MIPANQTTGTASLVLAVTGHRDLHSDDLPGFKTQILSIFTKLRTEYPHTPLLLLSGLAEGADRIAVRAAMEMDPAVPYIAVLPMPKDLYRQDFVTDASDNEFEELLKGALRCIELPPEGKSTPEDIRQPGPARDRQYEQLGRFLVEYSQILIAIWDQDRLAARGGTSHVVAMKLRQESPSSHVALARMNSKGAGPVYVLPARRLSSGPGMTPALRCDIRYPEMSVPAEYEASYRLLDRFNADIAASGPAFPNAAEKSRKGLFAGADAIGLSEPMEWVAAVYSRADALALRFSILSLRYWKATFALLAVGGAALATHHARQPPRGGGFLWTYYVCLVTAFLLMVCEWKAKRRGRHEDYRALAEALRVQFFWMAAGLRDMAAEQYLRKQAGEMVWIRDAVSECGLYNNALEFSPVDKSDRAARFRLAHTWVTGQAEYFLRTQRSHEKKKQILTVFAKVFAGVGFFAPLLGRTVVKEDRALMVANIGLWWAALAWNYIGRRALAQEARQYARMYALFHDVDQNLNKFEAERNFDASEEVIRELGREALAENGDWLSMHREKKLSVDMAAG